MDPNNESAIDELTSHPDRPLNFDDFIDTPYWGTFLHVWLEVNPLYRDILKCYVERKFFKENDFTEDNYRLLVCLKGRWHEAEKAAFTSRYEVIDWKTILSKLENMANHGSDILDQFMEELGRPAEYEDGVAERMVREGSDLTILSLKRGKKADEARKKIAAKTAAAAKAEHPQELCRRFFQADKTLFEHCQRMIDGLRKEIGEEKGTDVSHKNGEEPQIKDEEMT